MTRMRCIAKFATQWTEVVLGVFGLSVSKAMKRLKAPRQIVQNNSHNPDVLRGVNVRSMSLLICNSAAGATIVSQDGAKRAHMPGKMRRTARSTNCHSLVWTTGSSEPGATPKSQ